MADEPLKTWKTVAIRAVFGGIGFAIGAAAIIGIVAWYSGRPKAWDTNALKASFDTMVVTTASKQEPDAFRITFYYNVRNNTNKNYNFSASQFTPMAILTEGKAFSKDFGARQSGNPVVDGPAFIPPGSTARIEIQIPYLYPDDLTEADKQNFNKFISSVDNRLKEINSLVLFDQVNHYRIDLPEGWKTMDGVKEGTKSPNAKN